MPSPQPRTAIYARFSTELQHDRSIDDQVALCRAYAQREGLAVVAVHADRARSGGSTMGRDGLQALLAQAREGAIDVVLVEALDRLSRDMEDLAGIHKRLTFQGVQIRAVHEGAVNTVLVGLRGLIGQLYREDNAHKIRRGQEGRARAGLSPGGLPYGYAPVPGEPGKRRIVEDQAAVIRRICADFVAGHNARAIAGALNAEGVPAPGGGKWNASTINGSPARGIGILNNEIYAGRLVWNRVRMVRDPDSGRRLSRPNADGQRSTTALPDMAIVPEPLWQQVRDRLSARAATKPWQSRRPRRPLSGLLRCGACGAGMAAMGSDKSGRTRIRCSGHRERGDCPDPRSYYLDTVERAVLDGLKREMRDPRLIAEYARAYHAERQRLAADTIAHRADLERRLAAIGKEADRVTDWLIKGVGDPARLDARAKQLMTEEVDLRARLADAEQPANVVTLHPQALARYAQQLERLSESLGKAIDLGEHDAAAAIRELVETVTLRRGADGGIEIEVQGRLNSLLLPPPALRAVSGGLPVAEEGLEPPTPGL
ncbi:recombinase family protein [Sphingomonas hengshuiensis]|uniref:recombinase family protein n=1 Tax=Sphingomonas hengshuiensis TaxID=1609977 RepID=UPI0009809DC0